MDPIEVTDEDTSASAQFGPAPETEAETDQLTALREFVAGEVQRQVMPILQEWQGGIEGQLQELAVAMNSSDQYLHGMIVGAGIAEEQKVPKPKPKK